MARFNYIGYDSDGRRVTGDIEASSRTNALDVLSRRGCYPSVVADSHAETGHWATREVFNGSQLSIESLSTFTRELASLLRAGLTVDECLRLIAMQPLLRSKVQRTVRALQAAISNGQSLSSSMAAQGSQFPEFYWRLVNAGETSGALDAALEDLATYLEATSAMRARVASALIYPAILIVAALIAIGVVIGVLIPALTPLFEDARVPPPALISAMSSVDGFVREYWLWSALFGTAAVFTGVFARSSKPTRVLLDRALLRVPVVGGIVERRETGRLARTLGALLKGGVPLVEATHISASVMTNHAMAEQVQDASLRVREGSTLSEPLTRGGVFPELFVRLVTLGEQTGQLDAMLLRAGDIYDAALQRQLHRLIGLITPVVTIVIGGAVGALILSVMSALMSINDLALR